MEIIGFKYNLILKCIIRQYSSVSYYNCVIMVNSRMAQER